MQLNSNKGLMMVQYCKPMSGINLMCCKYANIGPLQACLLARNSTVVGRSTPSMGRSSSTVVERNSSFQGKEQLHCAGKLGGKERSFHGKE